MDHAPALLEKASFDLLARDFRASLKEVMDEARIDKLLSEMASFDQKYNAQCPIASAVFYVFVAPSIYDGKSAEGHGGGLFTPGGGGSWGHVYTKDLERLYRDTISFQVNATAVYLNVNFFDGYSNLLGHYHGGGVGTVAGTGGGTIRWK